MHSTFTWLDYSEHERRKLLDVIDLFGEKTRDELGLGGVRDVFADLLFPGTTTIQTVAKYFLFVPWMYMDLERKQVPSSKIFERARKFEIDLAKTLGDADGVIGKRAKNSLKRLPSSVYWQGLMAWGIRVHEVLAGRLEAIHDLFGQNPDTLEDAWVEIAMYNKEAAKQLIDRTAITRNPFDAKYSKVEDSDWETSPLVIDPIAVKELLRKSW
jgi:hypothetical protein